MDKQTRIEKIAEIMKRAPFGKLEIPWRDKLESMDTFKIPLKYLVYNKYNGRILSRTSSLETNKKLINEESEEGKKIIEKLLWDSNLGANKTTLNSIKKIGQEKVGIVTKDGIIIDGNRRAMLLNMAKKDYFKAIILPVNLNEDPSEIEKLETIYQLGSDEKVTYNAIEKYLKVRNLKKREISEEKIAEWMSESKTKIEEYLNIMETMDEYLNRLEYQGRYTQLDDREDQFIHLTKWLQKFRKSNGSRDAFDSYKQSDVDDLETIAFDYIRVKYEGKSFRNLAEGRNNNHIFGDEIIWKDFCKKHFEKTEPIINKEDKIDYDSENIEAHLNSRDNSFYNNVNEYLDENLKNALNKLHNRQAADKPAELIDKAQNAIESINFNHPAFTEPETMEKFLNLSKTIINKMNKSPLSILSQVLDLLEKIELDYESRKDEVILEKITQINKLSFDIKKKCNG